MTTTASEILASNITRIAGQDELLAADVQTVIGKNRLNTEAALHSEPSSNVVTVHKYLQLSGSKAWNVNGSSGSPQHFDAGPASGESWFVKKFIFYFTDTGAFSATNFASLGTPLTNGIDITIKSQGTSYAAIINIKDNADLTSFFDSTTSSTATLFSSSNAFVGELIFDNPIKLTQSLGDFFRVSVKDNLTGLDLARASIVGFKSI